jgi:xanthine dehydrogenase accessory factor
LHVAVRELQTIMDILGRSGDAPAALATLVRVEGSSYRRPGARLLLTAAGERAGSVSGGCLEEDLLERCRTVIGGGPAQTVVYDTTSENDAVWGVGLGCHGVVEVLVEPIRHRPAWIDEVRQAWHARQSGALAVRHAHVPAAAWGTRWLGSPAEEAPEPGVFLDRLHPPLALLVCGAGDDARPLIRMAAEFGWVITVVDPRPAYATAERFPEARRVVSGPIEAALPTLQTDERTAAVIMTHHYVHDLPFLRFLAERPLAYLGLLGPRRRAERLIGDLRAEAPAAAEDLPRRLKAPVGLDLGGDTPEAVALAILAEITATVHQRDARPLHERRGPIHLLAERK